MALNNFLRDPDHPVADIALLSPLSNERLIFFMDSALLAARTGPTWEVTDRGPTRMIGVLAHEFQHMIHFYQKPVLRDTGSPAWLNEMSSEVAQDLIADKLMDDGPRGVAYDDPTAGEPDNLRGRLPEFNFFNDIRVTSWEDDIANYSINYALGAYLARTYGAALFSDIVQSDRAGVDAIEGRWTVWGGTSPSATSWRTGRRPPCCRTTPRPPPRTATTRAPGPPRTPAESSTGWDRSTCSTTRSCRRACRWKAPARICCGAWPSSGRTCTPCGPSTRARSRRTPTCTPPSGAPPGPSA